LESEDVYASNPPIKYGNTIAGAVEIKTNSLLDKNETKVSLGVANMGGFLSKSVSKNSFVQFYTNYQFSDLYLPLNRKNSDFLKNFSSIDAGVNFRSNVNEKISLNIYSYMLKEKFSSEYSLLNFQGLLNSNGIRNFNILNLEYSKERLHSKLNFGATFMKTSFDFANLSNTKHERQYYLSFDNQISLFPNSYLQFGMADDYSYYSFDNTIPKNTVAIYPENETYTYKYDIKNHNIEAYSYLKLYFWHNSSLGLGLRKNIPVEKQSSYISYQGNIKLIFNNYNSVLLSAGLYNAYLSPDGAIFDFRKIKSSQVAMDYIFSKQNLSLSLSGYLKRDLFPVFYYEINNVKETEVNMWGVESSFDYNVQNVKLSGSYVILNSNSSFEKITFKSSNSLKYLIRSSFTYMSVKYINLSVAGTFHPGLLYTPIIGAEYKADINNYIPAWGHINENKHPSYMTFDLAASKLFTLKDANIVTYLTITNLFDKENIQAITYSKSYNPIEYKSFMKRLFYLGLTVSF
jgi:hypothetical protein